MCGIFGYVGTAVPDRELLTAAALAAGRRGPHGCGWVWTDGRQGLTRRVYLGPLTAAWTAAWPSIEGAAALLGHARLATVGDWRREDELQPVRVGALALAHNGVIRNAEALAPGHRTDSIALAHAYAAARARGEAPVAALDRLLQHADQRAWVVVALEGRTLYVHRHYHPCWLARVSGGAYLASQAFPPTAQLVPENHALVVTP